MRAVDGSDQLERSHNEGGKQMYRRIAESIFRVGPVEYLSVVLFMALVLIVFANVIMRYLFSAPLFWSDEIARYTFIWFCFLGALIALKRKKHYAIDYFVGLLPRSFGVALAFLADLIVIAILVILVKYGYEVNVLLSFQRSPLGLPIYYVYFALPLVGTLMTVVALLEFVERIRLVIFNKGPAIPGRNASPRG
jgi:TRAP-type C4-dicarboxylate transport system permease small subunit